MTKEELLFDLEQIKKQVSNLCELASKKDIDVGVIFSICDLEINKKEDKNLEIKTKQTTFMGTNSIHLAYNLSNITKEFMDSPYTHLEAKATLAKLMHQNALESMKKNETT